MATRRRQEETQKFRDDIAILRALIDDALDRGANTSMLRAATNILIDRKDRLAELELQDILAPKRRSTRPPKERPGSR